MPASYTTTENPKQTPKQGRRMPVALKKGTPGTEVKQTNKQTNKKETKRNETKVEGTDGGAPYQDGRRGTTSVCYGIHACMLTCVCARAPF